MSNVKEVKFGKQPPQGLAEQLRALADRVERGEVTSAIAAYVDDNDGGEYGFIFGASLSDEIVLSTLLQTKAVDHFRR